LTVLTDMPAQAILRGKQPMEHIDDGQAGENRNSVEGQGDD
jgi:hypothetical protein